MQEKKRSPREILMELTRAEDAIIAGATGLPRVYEAGEPIPAEPSAPPCPA